MKKHSVNKLPAPSIHSIIATQKLHDVDRKKTKTRDLTGENGENRGDQKKTLIL